MNDKDFDTIIPLFTDRLSSTLDEMDETEATEGSFECPVCNGIVHVKTIQNGDAYAYCETDGCIQTGLMHRHR